MKGKIEQCNQKFHELAMFWPGVGVFVRQGRLRYADLALRELNMRETKNGCIMKLWADLSLFYIRLAPYERRVIELLRNSKDKRARKLAKKRVRTFLVP